MKQWILAATILGAVSLQTVGASPLQLGFSSIVGSLITFDGSGNFTFVNSGTNDFQINNDNSGNTGANTALGLFGNLSGTFAMGTISGGNYAPITGSGTLTIHDSAAQTLTATVQWIDITTSGTGSTLNDSGVANLSGLTYTGTDADLVTLKNSILASGTLSFTFNPAVSLSTLKSTAEATTYSGTISAVPEPMTFSLMGAGLLGLGLLRKRLS
jgi:hypothetical protein